MATVSMTEGSRLVGRSKGTLSKALASGKLSYAEKTANGYLIDTSELFRLFPPKRSEPVLEARLETPQETADDKALRVEVQLLREQLEETRTDRDAWRDQAQRLLLEAPAQPQLQPKSRWRLWGRD